MIHHGAAGVVKDRDGEVIVVSTASLERYSRGQQGRQQQHQLRQSAHGLRLPKSDHGGLSTRPHVPVGDTLGIPLTR